MRSELLPGAFFLIVALACLLFTSTVPAEPPPLPFTPVDERVELSDLSFSASAFDTFLCKESGQPDRACEIYGNRWSFSYPWQTREEGLQALIARLKQAGALLLRSDEELLLARIDESAGSRLWLRFSLSSDSVNTTLVRERVLHPDGPVTFTLDDGERNEFTFYSEHPGLRFQRMDVQSDSGAIDFKGVWLRESGKMRHAIDYSHVCHQEHGPHHELYGIPQFKGRYRWTAYLNEGEGEHEVTVTLNGDGPALPEVKSGEALGGLLLRNVPYGAALALPEFDGEYQHPGFSGSEQIGDKNPEGEAVFWLPPGLWKVQVNPNREQSVTFLETHLVPVQPGEVTELEWPGSLAEAFAEEGSGRLEILGSRAETGAATVDISLLGAERTRVTPRLDNTRIIESGVETQVTAIERIETPLDVVVLLDSSGSMKGQMKTALTATANFIQSLPANADVTVIDFDTKPKPIEAKNRKGLLKALKKVRANGATALYDTLLEGLADLGGKNRPALVLFTDGVDANHNDTGPGSVATKDEVLAQVAEQNIPVFTIGFGGKSDVNTLGRVAAFSGGEYYTADDPEGLTAVFDSIRQNLGSQYHISYQRPQKAIAGNQPVLSLVIDNSGSMDTDPEVGAGSGYRIEKVRQIMRRFISRLPEEYLVQVMTFSGDSQIRQVMTRDKAAQLRALSAMEGAGATDILGSVEMSLKTLEAVPSTRRTLVYLTDAALRVDDDEQQAFELFLGQLKDANISTVWVGMVEEDTDNVFSHAAKISGGRTIIAPKLNDLDSFFETLGNEMLGAPPPVRKSLLRVAVTHRDEAGKNQLFSAAEEVEFPALEEGKQSASPEQVRWQAGAELTPYDGSVSRLLSGSDRVVQEVRISKRLPLDLEARNSAAGFHLKEALFLSRLRGIDAPEGFRYLALTLSAENLLPPQKVAIYADGANHPAAWVGGGDKPLRYEQRVPTYLIPDLRRHLFLRWNNRRSFPVSEVTWLAEEPLVLPGGNELALEAGRTVEGSLVFLVPSEMMQQTSLHLYDTNYGHLDIPISGVMEGGKATITLLPQEAPVKLSDAFSLEVTGVRDVDRIEMIEAGDGALFRIVDGLFTSRVQALLDIRPADRFKLVITTAQGSRFFAPHGVTEMIPLGFYRPTLLTPGARNPVRFVFRIPRSLAETGEKGKLIVDVAGGGVSVPVDKGGLKTVPIKDYHAAGDGVAVKVLQAGPVDEISGIGSRLIAVEVVVADEKGEGHTRIGDLIVLKNRNFDPEEAARRQEALERLWAEAARLPTKTLGNFAASGISIVPGMLEPLAAEYLLPYGLDSESVVVDGEQRRGVLFFALPEETEATEWEVGSLLLNTLSYPVQADNISENLELLERLTLEDAGGSWFWERVGEVVSELIVKRQQQDYRKPGSLLSKRVDLGEETEQGEQIPAPAITSPGGRLLKKIVALSDLSKQFTSVSWLPLNGLPWQQRYSPEAVLTQGWGSESDFARVAELVINRSGTETRRISVEVTDKGRLALAKMAGVEQVEKDQLPALWFRNSKGKEQVLVAPFMKDAAELAGLVVYKPGQSELEESTEKADISVRLLVKAKGKNRQQQTADLADALAGDSETLEEIDLLSTSIKLSDLSRDAVDIGFTKAAVNGRIVYQAVVDGPAGRVKTAADEGIDSNEYEVVGEVLEIGVDYETYSRRRLLDKGVDITGVFHTLGINLPDLGADSVTALQQAGDEARKQVIGKPDTLSTLRWYGRNTLARFIAAQSAYEKNYAETLGLVVGRTEKGRVLLVTNSKADAEGSVLVTTMDLLYPFNQIHQAPDPRAANAFNILTGIAAARVEVGAISGQEAMGLFDFWEKSPEDTRLIAIDHENRSDFIDDLKARGYPETVVQRLESTERVVLFPSKPALINDQPRWAWLEIDPRNYQTVSVLDTGDHGSLVEKFVGDIYQDATSYMVGGLVGISSSIWAVSAYSLELDNYQEILKESKKFVENLGKRFGVGVQAGAAQAGAGVGGKPGGNIGRVVKLELEPGSYAFGNNLLGFGNGYNDGVALYFQRAK
ncbi:MAG: VWA domain-containing protein [Candidatus Sedimenticola sp. (ex Thyasira tokunagai)]